jgi:integrase/recombinase XerD
MKNTQSLLLHIQKFFQDYLKIQRGMSPHTICSYRDTIKLLMIFMGKRLKKTGVEISLDDFTVDVILEFLKDIEFNRKNKIVTRNNRLAALRTFFIYLVAQDPVRGAQYQKIVAIPIKKAPQQPAVYLERDEMQAILESIDRMTFLGRRDHLILSLLYNTGARVQELCDLRVENVRLDSPAHISFTGKGQKIRLVPIWDVTAGLLKNHLIEQNIIQNPEARVFMSSRNTLLNRFSVRRMIQRRVTTASKKCPSLSPKTISPHTFRHTSAMHLLQSNVDITIIKSWLGHVNLSTTHSYVEIDMNMKRKALSACVPIDEPEKLKKVVHKNKDIIRWLNTFNVLPLCELKLDRPPQIKATEFT